MLRLSLFRHAKSDWSSSALDDFERPLAPRGQRAAPAMGRYFAARWSTHGEVPPDLIVVSAAVRARETWALAAAQWPAAPDAIISQGIYEASPAGILATIAAAAASRPQHAQPKHIVVVGHNPGLAELAAQFLRTCQLDAEASAQLARFPTGTHVELTLPEATVWREIAVHSAQLGGIMIPRRLPG